MTGQPGGGDLTIQVGGLEITDAPEGESGQAITLQTTRGPIQCLYHQAGVTDRAVVWVGGAAGGVGGPAGGIYRTMSEELADEDGFASLRLHYRLPNDFPECVMDVLAGVTLMRRMHLARVALVGHSFGGAVAIAAAPLSPDVGAVAALSSQTYGAANVARVSPRPLLLAHGEADTRLGPHCSQQIYEWAQEPKELVLFPGAGHGLRECRQELHDLLKGWLARVLPSGEATGA